MADDWVAHQVNAGGSGPSSPDVLKFADAMLFIRGLIITNPTGVTLNIYLGKQDAKGVPEYIIPPYVSGSVKIPATKWVSVSYNGASPSAGNIFVQFTDDSDVKTAFNALGSIQYNIKPARINWPNYPAGQVVTLPFSVTSFHVRAYAGSAYLFYNPAVTVPLAFDANGLPSDPSFIGLINRGADAIFAVPSGTRQVLFVPFGGNGATITRKSFGVNHYYPLDDFGVSAVDLVNGATGAYGPFCLLQQQPAINPDSDYSLEGFGAPPNGGNMTTPFSEINGGTDFSIELLYKKVVDTAGFNSPVLLYENRRGANVGIDLRDSGNQLSLSLANSISPPSFYQGNALALVVGTVYHIVLVVSVSTSSAAIYVGGANVVMNPGPGAPPLNAFANYIPGTQHLRVGATDDTGLKGYFQSLATYPSALTSSQIALLFQKVTNPSAPEVLAEFTDGLWVPQTTALV